MAKAIIIFTVFEILLSEVRSVLWPAQQGTVSERVKVSVKNQKKYWESDEIAWKMIELEA